MTRLYYLEADPKISMLTEKGDDVRQVLVCAWAASDHKRGSSRDKLLASCTVRVPDQADAELVLNVCIGSLLRGPVIMSDLYGLSCLRRAVIDHLVDQVYAFKLFASLARAAGLIDIDDTVEQALLDLRGLILT